MTNTNMTSNFIFGASERELLTLSMAELIAGLVADYKSFSQSINKGIDIPKSKRDLRMGHACILFAEGVRLAWSHPELGKKLIFASLFDLSDRVPEWFQLRELLEKREQKPVDILDLIASSGMYNTRPFAWFMANGETDDLSAFLNEIKAFEDWKAAERKKKEEEEEARRKA